MGSSSSSSGPNNAMDSKISSLHSENLPSGAKKFLNKSKSYQFIQDIYENYQTPDGSPTKKGTKSKEQQMQHSLEVVEELLPTSSSSKDNHDQLVKNYMISGRFQSSDRLTRQTSSSPVTVGQQEQKQYHVPPPPSPQRNTKPTSPSTSSAAPQTNVQFQEPPSSSQQPSSSQPQSSQTQSSHSLLYRAMSGDLPEVQRLGPGVTATLGAMRKRHEYNISGTKVRGTDYANYTNYSPEKSKSRSLSRSPRTNEQGQGFYNNYPNRSTDEYSLNLERGMRFDDDNYYTFKDRTFSASKSNSKSKSKSKSLSPREQEAAKYVVSPGSVPGSSIKADSPWHREAGVIGVQQGRRTVGGTHIYSPKQQFEHFHPTNYTHVTQLSSRPIPGRHSDARVNKRRGDGGLYTRDNHNKKPSRSTNKSNKSDYRSKSESSKSQYSQAEEPKRKSRENSEEIASNNRVIENRRRTTNVEFESAERRDGTYALDESEPTSLNQPYNDHPTSSSISYSVNDTQQYGDGLHVDEFLKSRSSITHSGAEQVSIKPIYDGDHSFPSEDNKRYNDEFQNSTNNSDMRNSNSNSDSLAARARAANRENSLSASSSRQVVKGIGRVGGPPVAAVSKGSSIEENSNSHSKLRRSKNKNKDEFSELRHQVPGVTDSRSVSAKENRSGSTSMRINEQQRASTTSATKLKKTKKIKIVVKKDKYGNIVSTDVIPKDTPVDDDFFTDSSKDISASATSNNSRSFRSVSGNSKSNSLSQHSSAVNKVVQAIIRSSNSSVTINGKKLEDCDLPSDQHPYPNASRQFSRNPPMQFYSDQNCDIDVSHDGDDNTYELGISPTVKINNSNRDANSTKKP